MTARQYASWNGYVAGVGATLTHTSQLPTEMYKIPTCVHVKDGGVRGFPTGYTSDAGTGGIYSNTNGLGATWGREFVSFGRTCSEAGDAKLWSGVYHLDSSMGDPNHFGGFPT